MRRALFASMLALAVGACDGGSDLREQIALAGVYSPTRSDGGHDAVLALGQLLFFDKELSGNRNIACASCHMPADHAGDQLALGRGQGATGTGIAREGGETLPRNTVSPFNRSFAESLFWDGRVEKLPDGSLSAPVPLPEGTRTLLEAQALIPILNRSEMRGQVGDVDTLGNFERARGDRRRRPGRGADEAGRGEQRTRWSPAALTSPV